ncbi:hypothetical protein F5Y15DRAFT_422939 [Xylariaceae sp. FL0016]|nr:hypothetical protein F5Y15DRAFT_422939 [Xylariaceae sp. FL0016]
MKPIFRNCTVILVGDVQRHDFTPEHISKWVELRGGEYSTQIRDPGDKTVKVTHVLCSEDAFKAKKGLIAEALKAKVPYFVTPDWLEDSINEKKRLNENGFRVDKALKRQQAKKKRLEKVKTGMEKEETDGGTIISTILTRTPVDHYHVFHDITYFKYEVILRRDDPAVGNVGQKHILTLWESNSKPMLYKLTGRFYKKPKVSRPDKWCAFECPKQFNEAFTEFKRFFRKKTGITWEKRIEEQGKMDCSRFHYAPPTGGKPIGLLTSCADSTLSEGGKLHFPVEEEGGPSSRSRCGKGREARTKTEQRGLNAPKKRPFEEFESGQRSTAAAEKEATVIHETVATPVSALENLQADKGEVHGETPKPEGRRVGDDENLEG